MVMKPDVSDWSNVVSETMDASSGELSSLSTSAPDLLMANMGEVADDLVVLLEQLRQDGARVETAGIGQADGV